MKINFKKCECFSCPYCGCYNPVYWVTDNDDVSCGECGELFDDEIIETICKMAKKGLIEI